MTDLRSVATNFWTWIFGAGIGLMVVLLNWARRAASDRATREHLALEKALRMVAEQKLADAEKRVDEMTHEVRELTQRLAQTEAKEQFDEASGVLFKRRSGGGYHDAVYCTVCKRPLVRMANGWLFCGSCKCYSPLRGQDVAKARSTLPD